MKYPNILFFRYSEYSDIDLFFETNKEKWLFHLNVIDNESELNKLFDPNFPILITYGDYNKYHHITQKIPNRFFKRWIHYDLNKLPDIDTFNKSVNYCFMHNVTNIPNNQISFSLFTTCYKSFDKIIRAYESIKAQELLDWEWVILDDSPNDTVPNHFDFLLNLFKDDSRIRLYKRANNSGNIGNVKNEAVLLCRGKYVLEMDHDDELLPNTLRLAYEGFESDDKIGFVYMNYSNIYENGDNFSYGNYFGLGYAGYYCQKYKDKWLNVATCPNINRTTLTHIVAVPNHPRIWRKDLLIKIGNYCELLPISDDYELLIRTALSDCKMLKINELGYIQYMNNGNNNFSLIRNSEINRLCADYIYPFYFNQIKELVNDENHEYKPIWKIDNINYKHRYTNLLISDTKFKKQIVFIGYQTLLSHIDNNPNYNYLPEVDYIVLDNVVGVNVLTSILEHYRLGMFKCYSMDDVTENQLVNYFKLILNSGGEYEIIYRDSFDKNPLYTLHIEHLNKGTNNKKMIIVTPSIRPENLLKIEEKLNFDYIEKWVIVYDGKKITENPNLFSGNPKVIEMVHKDENSISGNAQRNFALEHIKNKDSYVYFLDDDNMIHEDLYKLLHNAEDNKIYTFDQKRTKGVFPYVDVLKGDVVEVYRVDSGMVLIDNKLIGSNRWKLDKYNADGHFIKDCFTGNEDKWIYVNSILSNYNCV